MSIATDPSQSLSSTATGSSHVACDGAPVCADKGKHARGLLAIGLFKLGKFLFFCAVGLGALHLVHSNIGDLFLTIAARLHLNLDSELIGRLEDRADLISGHQLRQVSLLTIGYGLLSLVEGIGLMLEKTWAEYLTLTLTTGALPVEIYKLIFHPTLMHVLVLVTNLLVLAYLVWYVRKKRRMKREEQLAPVLA